MKLSTLFLGLASIVSASGLEVSEDTITGITPLAANYELEHLRTEVSFTVFGVHATHTVELDFDNRGVIEALGNVAQAVSVMNDETRADIAKTFRLMLKDTGLLKKGDVVAEAESVVKEAEDVVDADKGVEFPHPEPARP